MEVITRSFEIREVNDQDKTVTGLAVPYGVATDVGGYREQFERGAIAGHEGVKLFWNHQEIIGAVIRGADTEDGYEITARISDTTQGRDAYTLLKDGAIDKFSVGFIPQESRDEEGVTVRTKVDLKEVSLVPFPAYAGAQISEVRAELNNANENSNKEVSSVEDETHTQMETAEKYDDSEIRSELEVVKRELAVVRENGGTSEASGSQYRTAGDWLKALAAGEETAVKESRAYTGAVLADSHTSNDWKDKALVIVNHNRPLVSAFDSAPLGPSGMTVAYPKVNAVTGDVAVQAAEGDAATYLELDVDEATAAVKTYHVYSELSRQVIERSDVNYLDGTLRAQVASYAKITNGAVRTAIGAATPQTGTSFTLSSATAASFLGAAADGVQKIDTNGYFGNSADFILVSWDVYNKMITLVDGSGRPSFVVNGDGSNSVGNVNLVNVRASIGGIPVIVDSLLSAKTLYVCNSHAVESWENSGAPLRLDDENILTLAKQFAIYGYFSVGVKDANGLVKATIA